MTADPYGHLSAARVGVEMFETFQRQTGRTVRLVESARPGDRIIVHAAEAARYVEHLLRSQDPERARTIRVTAVSDLPNPMALLSHLQGTAGPYQRVLLDHEWSRRALVAGMRSLGEDLERLRAHLNARAPAEPPEPISRLTSGWL